MVLISPREAETEDVIVEEVTGSHPPPHTHTHTTHPFSKTWPSFLLFLFFTSQFRSEQQTQDSKTYGTSKLQFIKTLLSVAHFENFTSLMGKYSTASSFVKRVFSECPTATNHTSPPLAPLHSLLWQLCLMSNNAND